MPRELEQSIMARREARRHRAYVEAAISEAHAVVLSGKQTFEESQKLLNASDEVLSRMCQVSGKMVISVGLNARTPGFNTKL